MFAAAAAAWPAFGGRVGGEPSGDEGVVAGNEGAVHHRIELWLVLAPRLIGGGFHLAQEPLERGRPALLILLFQEGQLAQMMDVAQRMAALRLGLVGLPAIMHADAGVRWQDANRVGRFAAAPRVDRMVGEAGSAGHVRPGEMAALAHARLVIVQHWGALQRRLDRRFDWLQSARFFPHPRHQCSVRQLDAHHIAQQGLHPGVG